MREGKGPVRYAASSSTSLLAVCRQGGRWQFGKKGGGTSQNCVFAAYSPVERASWKPNQLCSPKGSSCWAYSIHLRLFGMPRNHFLSSMSMAYWKILFLCSASKKTGFYFASTVYRPISDGSVAELTCHLHGSTPYAIRSSHESDWPSPTKDVT
jgi:hypothetical protein